MLSSVLRLLGQPRWLAEHLQLYASLGHVEAALAWRTLIGRAAWAFVALGAGVVALNLLGMAALLLAAGMVDLSATHRLVTLGAVAIAPALGSAWAWQRARRPMPPWFSHLRAQAAEDWHLWQSSASSGPPASAAPPSPSTGAGHAPAEPAGAHP